MSDAGFEPAGESAGLPVCELGITMRNGQNSATVSPMWYDGYVLTNAPPRRKYAREFIDDDDGYQHWAEVHVDGFVINTTRNKSPRYMVLHRATCPFIRQYTAMAKPGGFTEREYIKICADTKAELAAWARKHGCTSLREGCICDP